MNVQKILLLCIIPFVGGVLVNLLFLFQNTSTAQMISPQASKQKEESLLIPELPSLKAIFSDNHDWTATLAAERKRIMIATGDIIPARSVNFQTVQRQDFTWPYHKTADILKNADLTFINLETPLLAHCPLTQSGMIFCGDARHVEGLVFAGIDIANLANNHAGNHAEAGIMETIQLLQGRGIRTTGINGAEIMTIRGIRFAFLGYNDISTPQPGIANVDEEKIRSEIAEAKKKADVVIVTYHWGVEYRSQPDERQKYLGHFTIDSGADLVIGNHPHWIQPIEFYKGKLITYAHGNFIFDQEWSLKTKQGVVGRYTFYDNKLVDVEFLPVLLENYGQPRFLEGEEKRVILEEMKRESGVLRAYDQT